MNIKRCPIKFNNILSVSTKCKANEWYDFVEKFRNTIIRKGLYATGPVIYKYHNIDKVNENIEFTFYLPINQQIDMIENKKYKFYKSLEFKDGLAIRHADFNEDIEECNMLLRKCAEDNKLKLEEPFLNIYLDVYGDGIIDIYAPIVEE